MPTNRPRYALLLPLFVALLGAAFSVWNAMDAASVPCVTVGCTMHQNFSVGGVSLWWVGTAAFVLLGAIALAGYGAAGRVLAALGVFADCVLLLVMIVTLPCLACMVAGALLAACYGAFRAARDAPPPGAARAPFSLLLVVWGVLFLLSAGIAVRGELRPWALQEPQEEIDGTPLRVFFSPSCSACRQLVTGVSAADAARIFWCPVAEDENDFAAILELQRRLSAGEGPLSARFVSALDAPPLSPRDRLRPDALLLQLRLWRNQAHALASGDGRLPLVEFMGVPSALIRDSGSSGSASTPGAISAESFGGQTTLHGRTAPEPRATPLRDEAGATPLRDEASPAPREEDSAELPLDLGDAGSCGGPDAVPCP